MPQADATGLAPEKSAEQNPPALSPAPEGFLLCAASPISMVKSRSGGLGHSNAKTARRALQILRLLGPGGIPPTPIAKLRNSQGNNVRISGGKSVTRYKILPEAGAFYVMDRGYVDFERLYVFTLSAAFFVVRTKSNILLQRRYSHSVDKATGVRSDHTVILTAIDSAKAYPEVLRRISYLDVETKKRFKFLTNNFTLPALTIALIYKSRWQVELFFKWIKQHLRIKSFYGTSENAVKTQIWIAVSVYVLVAIVRKRLALDASLYQILQILSVTLFEKTPILQALQESDSENDSHDAGNQLILFDF